MKASRFLVGAIVLGALAGSAFGQGDGLPTLPVATPNPPAAAPTSTSVLTTPAGAPAVVAGPGTVYSPACGPDGTCCGPFGANGPLTYELYARTGPSLVVGGSELSSRLNTGWQVGGGSNTLFFNTSRDAAWVLGTGLSYTYNRGRQERGGPLLVHTPPSAQGLPDGITPQLVRGLHRTTFDYSVGRDWWFRGPGSVGMECAPNTRFGTFVGGRYGTTHADLFSAADASFYLRKHSVLHSFLMGVHGNWERPMGDWIFFAGMRAEFEYAFLNVVPPQGSDVVSVNLLFTMGVRW